MQGYRYCVAGEDFVILSVHHTRTGASAFVKRNGNLPRLNIYDNGLPYAVAVGDLVPERSVIVEPIVPPKRVWKHQSK